VESKLFVHINDKNKIIKYKIGKENAFSKLIICLLFNTIPNATKPIVAILTKILFSGKVTKIRAIRTPK
jgi:ribosomal protein L23